MKINAKTIFTYWLLLVEILLLTMLIAPKPLRERVSYLLSYLLSWSWQGLILMVFLTLLGALLLFFLAITLAGNRFNTS